MQCCASMRTSPPTNSPSGFPAARARRSFTRVRGCADRLFKHCPQTRAVTAFQPVCCSEFRIGMRVCADRCCRKILCVVEISLMQQRFGRDDYTHFYLVALRNCLLGPRLRGQSRKRKAPEGERSGARIALAPMASWRCLFPSTRGAHARRNSLRWRVLLPCRACHCEGGLPRRRSPQNRSSKIKVCVPRGAGNRMAQGIRRNRGFRRGSDF